MSYERSRLTFFKEQLARAKRGLKWALEHSPDAYEPAARAEEVMYYQWAVEMASLCGLDSTGWINVEDALPFAWKNGEPVEEICTIATDGKKSWPMVYDWIKGWETMWGALYRDKDIIAWMPLPNPPKDKEA